MSSTGPRRAVAGRRFRGGKPRVRRRGAARPSIGRGGPSEGGPGPPVTEGLEWRVLAAARRALVTHAGRRLVGEGEVSDRNMLLDRMAFALADPAAARGPCENGRSMAQPGGRCQAKTGVVFRKASPGIILALKIPPVYKALLGREDEVRLPVAPGTPLTRASAPPIANCIGQGGGPFTSSPTSAAPLFP